MKCPKCQCKTLTRDTRNREGYIYRRRECSSCRFRFTTSEHWISQTLKDNVDEFRYPEATQDLSKILAEAILGSVPTDSAEEPKEQDLPVKAADKLASSFAASLGRYCKECYCKLDESNLLEQICQSCKEARFGKDNEEEETAQVAELAL